MPPCMHTSVAPRGPRLSRAVGNFLQREIVRTPAQVLAHLAFGEGTELAFERTDVSIIDVACDDVRHRVAAGFPTQRIRGRTNRGVIVIARFEKAHDFVFGERVAGACSIQYRRQISACNRRCCKAQSVSRQRRGCARRPVVAARPTFGIDPTQQGGAQTGGQPTFWLEAA